MTRPFRGVNGYRSRENDERHCQALTTIARFTSTCADTGAAIQIGDIIQLRQDGRVVLVKSCRPHQPTESRSKS